MMVKRIEFARERLVVGEIILALLMAIFRAPQQNNQQTFWVIA